MGGRKVSTTVVSGFKDSFLQHCSVLFIHSTSEEWCHPLSAPKRVKEGQGAIGFPLRNCLWVSCINRSVMAIVYWELSRSWKAKTASRISGKNNYVSNVTFKDSILLEANYKVKQACAQNQKLGEKHVCWPLTSKQLIVTITTHLTRAGDVSHNSIGLSSIIFCIHGQPEDENQTVWPEHL